METSVTPRALPSLRLRVMLPSAALLGALLLGLTLLGSAWVDGENQRLGKTRAEAALQGLRDAAELSATGAAIDGRSSALPRAFDVKPEIRDDMALQRALDREPLLCFAALRRDRDWKVEVHADDDCARVRKDAQALLTQLEASLQTTAVRQVAGMDVAVARLRVPGGVLMTAISLSRQGVELSSRLHSLLLSFAVAVAAYGLVLLFLLGSFSRRLEVLAAGARRLESGDLRARVGTPGDDELGLVGRAFDATAERLAAQLRQSQTAAAAVARSSRDVAEAADVVRRGTAAQITDIDEAIQAARELIQAQASAVQKGDGVRDETRLTAGVAQRLATVSQEAATALEDGDRLAQATGEAARQLYGSVAELARQASGLTDTAGATASAMQDVRQSINRVRETALSAAGLAEHASLDAERGTMVLESSLAGIEGIREASRAIAGVTDGLQQRVGEIGNVLHLITELTQRTNLLALNASIIAAQAGAEGRGFAVVADEIKDLARRTANSAGNIDSLIQALAEGAHAARRTALSGGEAVEAGAAQAREAARALGDILGRLRSWNQLARGIASATEDQTRTAGQVLRTLQELQNQVGELAGKATEQARRGEHLQRQAGRLSEIVGSLGTATQEMREGTAQVADTLTRLTRAVEDLSGSQRSRVAEGERVRGMLEVARRIAGGHREAVATLERAVADLRALSDSLTEDQAELKG